MAKERGNGGGVISPRQLDAHQGCSFPCMVHLPQTAWSAEEDALLLALHQQLGNAWSAISKRLGARTPQQCRCRFIQLSGNPVGVEVPGSWVGCRAGRGGR